MACAARRWTKPVSPQYSFWFHRRRSRGCCQLPKCGWRLSGWNLMGGLFSRTLYEMQSVDFIFVFTKIFLFWTGSSQNIFLDSNQLYLSIYGHLCKGGWTSNSVSEEQQHKKVRVWSNSILTQCFSSIGTVYPLLGLQDFMELLPSMVKHEFACLFPTVLTK